MAFKGGRGKNGEIEKLSKYFVWDCDSDGTSRHAALRCSEKLGPKLFGCVKPGICTFPVSPHTTQGRHFITIIPFFLVFYI